MITKNNIIWISILIVGLVFAVLSLTQNKSEEDITKSTLSESPKTSISPFPSPSPSQLPKVSRTPLPTGDGRTTFVGESVPWHLLLSDASCELKGEIKFINANTYDNQDAVFIYNGIDHPARNIKWTKTPDDGSLAIGPNIFSKIPIPNGQLLLGVFPLETPGSKRYELTAKIAYGRLVDENGKFVTAGGNVKIFEKQCDGKTVIVFP